MSVHHLVAECKAWTAGTGVMEGDRRGVRVETPKDSVCQGYVLGRESERGGPEAFEGHQGRVCGEDGAPGEEEEEAEREKGGSGSPWKGLFPVLNVARCLGF